MTEASATSRVADGFPGGGLRDRSVTVSPDELRLERLVSGLSLTAVARAAGTSATNVSAYERGAKRANDATLGRLTAAVRAGSDSPIHRNRLVTVPAAAAAHPRWAATGLVHR